MDSFQQSEDIKHLKNLCHHYEEQLSLFGIQIDDIPSDVLMLLDQCVDIQKKTNFHDLCLSYLKEYYFNRKQKHIENKACIQKLKIDIQEQKDELQKEESECSLLEKFIATCNKRLKNEVEMENNKNVMENTRKALQKRLDSMKVSENFNIDDLMNRIEFLNEQSQK